jgi:hypothetical protein
MHYLKKEFNRLKKYTEGLGVKVTIKHANSPNSAEWAMDGSEIIIYNKNKKSLLQLCLDFYHELGHHRAWIERGRKDDLKTDKILAKQDAGHELTKAQRRHIYEMERSDSHYQIIIHNEMGSKLPIWRIKAEIKIDLWIYNHYWKTGLWPLRKNIKAYRSRVLKR